MITYATDKQKQNVIIAWKTAFPNDSESFVQFYFEKKYSNENTLLYFKDDEMASCLQMLPYKMSYYGKFIKTSYISGACTLSAYQNQGLMGNLLVHAFGEMKRRKNALTILIPQEPHLVKFYRKFGYTPCFEYELTEVNPNQYPRFPDKIRVNEFESADLMAAFSYYKNHFIGQNLCIQKSLSDFSIMVTTCQSFEGNVYVLVDKGETVGLCFCIFTNGKVILKDCIAKDENYRTYFLSKLTEKFSNHPLFLYSPVTQPSQSEFLGMARILDASKLLVLFAKAHPQLVFSVKVRDEHIIENNAVFSVSHGEVAEIAPQPVDFDVSIAELTQLLFGYRVSLLGEKYTLFPQQHPYMSLMLE